jgi:hypothetical protein
LGQCLEFNPYFRYSATEVIANSCFDLCRSKPKQKSIKLKLMLDIDKDEAFDYEKGISEVYKLSDFQNIIAQELRDFK